jgi:Flp pilus assembly protein TadG
MNRVFLHNQNGNIAVAFSLALLPVVGAIGAAIDYSRWSATDTALQVQVDSAALSAISHTRDPERLLAIESGLSSRVHALPEKPTFSKVEVEKISDDRDAEAIVMVSAEGTIKTTFMNIFGFPTLPIAAVAEARRTPKTYEISLIVDVTGSMRGAAINSLRQASRAFVNTLLPEATESDRILINLVPYNSSVNIGRARGEWLGPLPTAPTGPAGSARFANKYIWEGGNEVGKVSQQQCLGTGVSWNSSLQVCHIGSLSQWTGPGCPGIESDGVCYVSDGWSGCVEERGRGNHDVTDATWMTMPFASYYWPSWGDVGNPTANAGYNSYLPVPVNESQSTNTDNNNGRGPNLGCPQNSVTDWTNDRSFLLQQIESFGSWHRGGTMGHAGLAWGWRTLSPKWAGQWGKFSAPRPYDRSLVEKIAVFMTDGFNEFYYNHAEGHSPPSDTDYTSYGRLSDHPHLTIANHRAYLDEKMLTVCNSMRQEGIEIFTVGLGVASYPNADSLRATLRTCATSPDHYLEASTADLAARFQSIAENIYTRGERLSR